MPVSSTHLTRRRFLKSTTIAAAGLAVPYFVPRSVLSSAENAGANDRIGIAGIGVGRQGGGLVRGSKGNKDVRMVAVADVNLPRAQDMAKALGAERAAVDAPAQASLPTEARQRRLDVGESRRLGLAGQGSAQSARLTLLVLALRKKSDVHCGRASRRRERHLASGRPVVAQRPQERGDGGSSDARR